MHWTLYWTRDIIKSIFPYRVTEGLIEQCKITDRRTSNFVELSPESKSSRKILRMLLGNDLRFFPGMGAEEACTSRDLQSLLTSTFRP